MSCANIKVHCTWWFLLGFLNKVICKLKFSFFPPVNKMTFAAVFNKRQLQTTTEITVDSSFFECCFPPAHTHGLGYS